MKDMIKIPYLGMALHIDNFFGTETAQVNKELIPLFDGDMREAEYMILNFALNNFRPLWYDLERKFGHLYGLWDDCIEPQIREWFGFAPSDHINKDRQHLYFECRHREVE